MRKKNAKLNVFYYNINVNSNKKDSKSASNL